MTTKHTYSTPYGGREIYRDSEPFAVIGKPKNAPQSVQYHNDLSAFGRLAAAAPEMAEEISKEIEWLKHLRAESKGVLRESLLFGIDQSIKYLSRTLAKARGEG